MHTEKVMLKAGCLHLCSMRLRLATVVSAVLFLLNFTKCAKLATRCSCPRPQTVPSVIQEWRVSTRMIMLGDCSFHMGSESSVAIRGDGEDPVRLVRITTPFWIDKTEVTKGEFLKFIRATKYKTTAEEQGTSFVFSPKITSGRSPLSPHPGWWIERKRVTWKTDFTQVTRDHPVTHVSWTDALEYCNWRFGTLPTEIQWEFACRGGLEKSLFPWGDKLRPDGVHMTNIWQGQFPVRNTLEDGFETTAPAGSYPPNGYGLHDVVGNVWEWVLDSWSTKRQDVKIQKGGSFMCHRMHCFRYRCGARTKGSADSTTSNLGFRCAEEIVI